MAKTRRNSVSRKMFLATYVPMAKEGKTALEIGKALGIEGPDDKVSLYVTVKACQIRTHFKDHAEMLATSQKLEGEAREAFIAGIKGKVPKLQSRKSGGNFDELIGFVDNLMASLDLLDATPPADTTETTEEIETPEAPKRRKRS